MVSPRSIYPDTAWADLYRGFDAGSLGRLGILEAKPRTRRSNVELRVKRLKWTVSPVMFKRIP